MAERYYHEVRITGTEESFGPDALADIALTLQLVRGGSRVVRAPVSILAGLDGGVERIMTQTDRKYDVIVNADGVVTSIQQARE